MQSVSQARLPPELCDIILDHLWDDHCALGACSLTHRAWLQTTRLHLFNTVSLLDSAAYARLERILEQSPDVARYVRVLYLKSHPRNSLECSELPRILLLLNNVEHLTLKDWHLELSGENRRDLSAFFPVVKTLSLVSVHLEGDVFPQLLGACQSLSAVHVTTATWFTPFNLQDSPAITPTQNTVIDTLTVQFSSSRMISWLLRSSIKLHLRNLHMVWNASPSNGMIHSTVQDLLQAAGTSLERLDIAFDSRISGDELPITPRHLDMSYNTRLVSFHFGCYVDGRFPLYRDEFDWVPNALSQLHDTHPDLQDVEVSLELYSPTDVAILDWQRIDENLADLVRELPHLVVTFRLFKTVDSHSWTHEAMDAVVMRVPKLRAAKSCLGVVCYNSRAVLYSPGSSEHGETSAHEYWFP
ncbi:hypothetical protein AcV5_009063 [Taiwanofungus camphoratus]|nr:hypothetical protein AcV5_009063 [Antrodia cinnamomea]